ncbi:hypothetical protein TSTA_062870 [Talaromyces stipitatus ATCC 10500]|uniref:Uncharacterized protein n=1 Tax=Talaromyces stipitatus (strain ATCC 10500 / CBS 375.48 / QM 6759 / NRRL 1006) TaxID=441959 RepID=B8LXY5_TALSN|nr:uncharacterized protein TSTA_062870 [Talaromyces stipitatus ATCC 10500]EED22800.1 hypothetical protein TSTA_062870 [Talaromyces stipitatus ATCC 10500]
MVCTNGVSDKPIYYFGIELEMFAIFKSGDSREITTEINARDKLIRAADEIVQLYNEAISGGSPPGEVGVKYPVMIRPPWGTEIVESYPTRWEINCVWEIHDDRSLYMFGVEQCDGWPVEFASPIFDYSNMLSGNGIVDGPYVYPWLNSIKKLFSVLHENTIVLADDECSLQVSVSANEYYGWENLDQVKSLAKSILYFEGAIRSFLPYHRRNTAYAKWNGLLTRITSTVARWNPHFENTSGIESRIALVDACTDVEGLVELMNNGTKRWSWNFTNLEADADSDLIRGRVEFRSPPAVDDWRECVAWIHFAIEFVHASISMKATIRRLGAFGRDSKGLVRFIDSVAPLMSADEKAAYRRELGLLEH